MFSPGPLFRNNESPFQMEWLRAVLAEFGGTFFITFLPTLALTAVFREYVPTFSFPPLSPLSIPPLAHFHRWRLAKKNRFF